MINNGAIKPVRLTLSSEGLRSVSISDLERAEEYVKRSDVRKEFQRIMDSLECSPVLAAEIGIAIELVPSCNVVPVQYSHWIKTSKKVPVKENWIFRLFGKKTKSISVVKCSNCGIIRKSQLKYCSNCGCKMSKNIFEERKL